MSLDTCERCGSYNGLPADQFRWWDVPDEFDYLCRDCAEEVNTHTLDDMTDDEIAAAIMDDSLGYAGPRHAARHVQESKDGKETAYCERGHAVFDGDLDELMARARRHWCGLSETKQERLLAYLAEWRKNPGPEGFSGISTAYPVSGP